jgi:hypothetical protein
MMVTLIKEWRLKHKLKKQWEDRKSGKEIVDFERGCGYYITLGLIFHNPIGKIQEWPMQSGKTMKVKLLSYERYSDPDDMVKSSKWQAMGYLGEKEFKDMTFDEYYDFYTKQEKV